MEDVKSDFNTDGMEIRLSSGSEVSMTNVKSNFNTYGGIALTLAEGSEGSTVTMENVEASFNKKKKVFVLLLTILQK